MKSAEEILSILHNATGSEYCHKFSPFPFAPLITDGVRALADAAGCYWLLDVIASHQLNQKLDRSFQVWKMQVNTEKGTAVIQGYNDTKQIVEQKISYTDFPLAEIKLFLIDGILLLPSEN